MAITVRIVKKGYGHSVGQVLSLTEFDAGHLMAFGYAVPVVQEREKAIAAPPEVRVAEAQPLPATEAGEIVIKPLSEPVSFFNRRGRRKKT